MDQKPSLKASIRKSVQERREEISLEEFQLTTTRCLAPEQLLPLIIEPSIRGVNLVSWAANSRDYLRTELLKHGAILFKNFQVDAPEKFEALARSLVDGELFDEYGDLPRVKSRPSSCPVWNPNPNLGGFTSNEVVFASL